MGWQGFCGQVGRQVMQRLVDQHNGLAPFAVGADDVPDDQLGKGPQRLFANVTVRTRPAVAA
ncbi:MAG: hypothetical protein AAF577_06590 [Pseudomonadota bacterium]